MKRCIGHEYRKTEKVKTYREDNIRKRPQFFRRHVCVHCGAEDYKEEPI